MPLKNNLKKQYKKPPSTFGTARKNRVSLGREQQERRRKRRTLDFEKNRNENPPRSALSQNDEPRTKLLDWKAEREKKKKEQSQKKPPFVVGIVHHHVYSPVSTSNVASTERKKTVEQAYKNSNVKKGITKATEKRLLAKAAQAKRKTYAISARKKSANDQVQSDVNERKSFAPSNHKFNPPAGLPDISLFKACKEDSLLNEDNIFARDKSTETADQISNHFNFISVETISLKASSYEQETSDSSRKKQINSTENLMLNNNNVKTLSLGFSLHTFAAEKENCSKDLIIFPDLNTEDNIKSNKKNDFELYQASGSSGLSDKLATKSAIMENLDLSISPIGEKEYTVECFERMLNKERNRLQKLCEKWTEIQLQDGIPEDISYQINQAVGQTTMLIKNKFKQFHGLILDCDRNVGDVRVTCTDLHGFWDMMYIEVKDCNSRFARLEGLRARHWQEDQSLFAEPTKSKKKTVAKKKIVPIKRSSLQALILSDKKKKKMAEDNDENSQQIINVNNECVTPCITNKRSVRVLKKISNIMRDKRSLEPAKYMYTSTPFSANVMPNVSSQLSTPLITMKVSQLYNKSTVQLDDTMLFGKTPEQTRRRRSLEKSEKNSLRIKTCKTNLDEKLEINQNSEASTEMNKFHNLDSVKHIDTEGKSDSVSDNSGQTVIENTVMNKNNTFVSSLHSTNSNKTPERKKFIKESSNKNLKTRLFRNSMHSVVKNLSGTPSTISKLSTPRESSIHYDVRNIDPNKITPRTDRDSPKKCNSSMKISWDKASISDDSFIVVGKHQKTAETSIFPNETNIN